MFSYSRSFRPRSGLIAVIPLVELCRFWNVCFYDQDNRHLPRKSLLLSIAGFSVFLSALPASGNEALKPVIQSGDKHASKKSGRSRVEDIVVTAQRRRENMQRVGIAMSSVSGTQLVQAHITSPSQIATLVSNVQLAQPNGQGAYTLSVRGVTQNDFADHEEGPAAIYLDGAYISQMTGLAFQIFDLERVEVLRGPQGTLYGRNATAGLAQFISAAPTDKLDGYLRFGLGSYREIRSEAAIGGAIDPLQKDRRPSLFRDVGS